MPVNEISAGFGFDGFPPSRDRTLSHALNSLQQQVTTKTYKPERPLCIAYLTGTASAANATSITVSWSAAAKNFTGADGVAMWAAASPTRITIPSEYSSGWWDVYVSLRWSDAGAGGRRVVTVYPPGLTVADIYLRHEVPGAAGVETIHTVGKPVLLNAGDQLVLSIFQSSGAALTYGRANGSTKDYWEGSMLVRWSHPDG